MRKKKKRKIAERIAKEKAAREKRKAEKAKKKAEKKVNEKGERYKKYLEGGKESKDTDKPKKESVYECAHFEYEYDDLGKYCWCRNRESDRRECNCNYIYAQQFCPFYKKGELRGKWVIGDVEKQAAEEFKKTFVGKEE